MLSAARGAPAAGAEVVAIVSKDIAPYKRALAGVTRTLPGQPVEMLDPDEATAVKRVKDRKPGAVVAIGVKAAKAARLAVPNVPVVYCLVLDPAGNGLVGPEAIGVPFQPSLRDEIEALTKALPAVSRVGVVINANHPPADLDASLASASRQGVTLEIERASDASELLSATARLAPTVDALAVLADPSIVTRDTFKAVADLAIRRKLPTVAATEEFAKLGALISLYMEFEEAGHDAAVLAGQLAAGKKPADVAPPAPSWQIVVNQTTAEAIGAKVAPAVLRAAQKIR